LLQLLHNEKPDAIFLCETWLKSDISLYHTGYKQYRSDNDSSMIIVNSQEFNPMKLAVPKPLQKLLVSILLLGDSAEIGFFISYYSKPGPGKSQRDKILEDYLERITTRYRGLPVILYSDFNSNMISPSKNYPGKKSGFNMIKGNKNFTREQLN